MKYEKIIDDKDLAKYVEAYNILTHVEYIIEDMLEEKRPISFCIDGDIFEGNTVKVRVLGDDKLCNSREHILGRNIEFVCEEEAECLNTSLSSILQKLFNAFYNITKTHLHKHLFEDVEYMEVVLAKGISIVVQGFEKTVYIPHIEDIVFIAHTHPRGYPPIPSKKDLLSMRDVIAGRGLGGCVHSAQGSFCMYRVGIPTWRDYESLTLSINRGGEIRDVCSSSLNIRCFTSFPTLDSI
ncbi:MAG: hypothetical protein QW348_02260 [Ignisphaera sp.]